MNENDEYREDARARKLAASPPWDQGKTEE